MSATEDRKGWELRVIQGASIVNEYQLVEGKSYILGRREQNGEWKPDIDLFPDTSVSRRHARLSFENGSWRISDIGSSSGTRIDGQTLKAGDPPFCVHEGSRVQMGDTIWTLSPSDVVRVSWHQLDIKFRLVPTITYSLYHCNVPVITDFRIINRNENSVGPVHMRFSIPGYSDPSTYECDEIPPDGNVTIDTVPVHLHYEKLEGHTGKKRTELLVLIDDDLVARTDVDILGFYEWPIHTAYRKSLACFVQPSHPVVDDIVAEANAYLKQTGLASSFSDLLRSSKPDRAFSAFSAIYETLRDRYDIKYTHASPGSTSGSQTIRPPHGVITQQRQRKGEGTCIDLAVLAASALEHVSLQPVIIIQRVERQSLHAMVACWHDVTARFEPVIRDHERLLSEVEKGRLLPMEMTGFTDRFMKNRADKPIAAEAFQMAIEELKSGQLLFALDVAAARQTVTPIQMPLDPDTLAVVRTAEQMVQADGSERLETKHLLQAMVIEGRECILDVLKKAGGDPSIVSRGEKIEFRVPKSVPRATVNYRRCLEDAKIAASDEGIAFVGQEHLFYAILQSQSKTVDELLKEMGTDRSAVEKAFDSQFFWTASLIETHYE